MKVILFLALALVIGCASKKPPVQDHAEKAIQQAYEIERLDPNEVVLTFEDEKDPNLFDPNAANESQQKILFGFNSSEVVEPFVVRAWADNLIRTKRNAIVIGHACPIGAAEYNYSLGLARAQSVQSMLIEFGVLPNRIQALSKGESEPLTTIRERFADNRRVEIQFRE